MVRFLIIKMPPLALTTLLWVQGSAGAASPLPLCDQHAMAMRRDRITPTASRVATEVLSAGPEQWVSVSDRPIPGYVYQRGMSGGIGLVGSNNESRGAHEMTRLILGLKNSKPLNASVMRTLKDSPRYMEEVNRSFSIPFVIRGDAKLLALDELTEAEPSSAAIISENSLGLDEVHSVGAFINTAIVGNSEQAAYIWAANYLRFARRMAYVGILPHPGSRGEKFLVELNTVWETREWLYNYKENFGWNELLNKELIGADLQSLFLKYSRQ